jgi:hypothetical protein
VRRDISLTTHFGAAAVGQLAFYLAAGFVQVDQISTALGTGLRMSIDLA